MEQLKLLQMPGPDEKEFFPKRKPRKRYAFLKEDAESKIRETVKANSKFISQFPERYLR